MLDKPITKTSRAYICDLVINNEIIIESSYLKKDYVYEYGLWDFMIMDHILYATMKNTTNIQIRNKLNYERHRLVVCIIIGSLQGIMCIRNVDGIIGSMFANEHPELSGFAYDFNDECQKFEKYYDEYLETYKQNFSLKYIMPNQIKMFLPNSGRIFVRNEMTLTHETNGITIRNEGKFPIVFPKHDLPIICGRTTNELINEWYDTPISSSYDSPWTPDGGPGY
jgi:hypothetical protein